MVPFELAQPRTLDEALALLDPDDEAVRPMSGGTALMLMMKAGVLRPRRLVSLERLSLEGIEIASDKGLRIGALARLSDIERAAQVGKGWPVITRTLRTLSNVRVRNVARIGGGLAHGDPHMDLPPLLCALGAEALVVSRAGERRVKVEDIATGYMETSLKRGELIREVRVPSLGSRRAVYLKCTARSTDDWPALGVAAVLGVDADKASQPSLFVSAATDRPVRLKAAEAVLAAEGLGERAVQRASEAAAAEAPIVGDQHGSAAYKKQLLRVYLSRALNEARHPSH